LHFQATMRPRFNWGLLALSLYLLSLFTPCVIVQKLFGGGHETADGLACLILGWCTIPWYANVMLLSAVIANALRKNEVAIVFAAFAIVAACTLLGYNARDIEPHVGYWIWIASMLAAMVASITGMHDRDEREARERDLLTLMRAASRDPRPSASGGPGGSAAVTTDP